MTRLRLCALVVLLAVPVVVRVQAPVFSSKVETVRVDALVTRFGVPVRNLRASDFEVLDNGVRQTIDLVSFEELPVSVVLTLDMSDSVVGERLAHLRGAGLALLDGLKAEDRAALVSFNSAVQLRAGLTTDIARVRSALALATPSGYTSLVDATYAALVTAESEAGRSLVVVFSDGTDTSSWLAEDAVIDASKRSDAVVYAVSTGRPTQKDFLRDIAEQTGGRQYRIESTRQLDAVFVEVLKEFRQRYLVSYSPQGVTRDGWHRLTVRVPGRGDATVKARPGYFAGQ